MVKYEGSRNAKIKFFGVTGIQTHPQCLPCLHLQEDPYHIANEHESSPMTRISCSILLEDYLENPCLCDPVLKYMLTH